MTDQRDDLTPAKKYRITLKNGETRYRRRVELGRDPITGKRLQKWITARTYREWQALAARERAKVVDGVAPTTASRKTVAQFLESDWLPHCASNPSLRPATIRNYRHRVEKYIVPYLGDRELRKLTTLEVQQWVDTLSRSYAASSVRGVFQTLQVALRLAVRWKILVLSPCEGVSLPKLIPPPIPDWSFEQTQRLLDGTRDHPYHIAFRLLALCGLRLGELQALTWHDVDFAVPSIRIRQTITRDLEGREVLGEPKTPSSRREIMIDDETAALLKRHPRTSIYIVPGRFGGPVKQQAIRWNLNRACEALGLPVIHPHVLRHAHGTDMMARGVHPSIAMQRMGHVSHQMMTRYTHPKTQHQRDVITKLFPGEDADQDAGS